MSERKKPASQPPPSTLLVPRTVSPDEPTLRQHPIGTPRGLSTKGGVMAVAAWLSERGIFPPQDRKWCIEIALGTAAYRPASIFVESIDTRFHLTISPDEWSYYFAHAGRASRVRVSDVAHADARDDYQLASATPALRQLSTLVRQLEQRFNVYFNRHHATIETTLPGTEPIIRAWLTTL